jgi:hypothetical protein
VIENELENAMKAVKAEAIGEGHRKYDAGEPMPALVECEVCDRSHAPNHPHIANIEGDIPIDDPRFDGAPVQVSPAPPRELPDWLRDKPAAEVKEDDKPQQICQVCGNPWAPRHACIGKEEPGAKAFNAPISKSQTRCDTCGKIKRSNHNCKAQATVDAVKVAERCEDCERAGELCVRHGGVWSDYDTPRGGDERVAKTLPAPTSVTQPETTHNCRKGHPRTPENTYIRSDGRRECKECKRYYHNTGRPALQAEADPELAAIGTILRAVDGLEPKQLKRVMSYVAARLEENA